MPTLRRALAVSVFALGPLALSLASVPAAAQDAERMDEIVAASADKKEFMGTALVAIGDEIVFDKAYGSADLEWNIANTTDTKFRIGSVTKQFTAASILLLQERKLLDIDQPVKTYWPGAPDSWDAITVRHLLNHTSGIPNVTSFDDFREWKYLPTARDELIARFSDKPLEFTPGEKWSYSNSGYLVLSAIVEEVGGKPYADFVDENLFTPLGMEDTAIDVTAQIVPQRAEGYSPSDSGIVNADYVDMGIPQGAGALYSTTHDLLKWQRGLFGGQLLTPESIEAFRTPAALETGNGGRYALGVLVTENDQGISIWHGGGIEGFNSWLGYDPERDITVAVLANLNGGAANTLGQSLLKLARGGEVTLAAEREAVEVPTEAMAEYEGVYALAPTFKIRIFREGDRLMTQATGQSAFPIFVEGPDRFFLKVVDAQLRFDRGESGEIEGLTLFQGGNEMSGAKE